MPIFGKRFEVLLAVARSGGVGIRHDNDAVGDGVVLENPTQQLEAAVEAVYRSWTSDRARTYRRIEHLEDLRGTAVAIQAMVFGNRGLSSAGGVAFSRDPSTGSAMPVIDILFELQGEDVVSGTRNPETEEAMARFAPTATRQLREILKRLEQEFADVQDVEFTVEDGKLWILQTRVGKADAAGGAALCDRLRRRGTDHSGRGLAASERR